MGEGKEGAWKEVLSAWWARIEESKASLQCRPELLILVIKPLPGRFLV